MTIADRYECFNLEKIVEEIRDIDIETLKNNISNEAVEEMAYILSKVVLVGVCSACKEDMDNIYHILNTRYEIRGEVK